jgi:hypothetical protein
MHTPFFVLNLIRNPGNTKQNFAAVAGQNEGLPEKISFLFAGMMYI